MGAVLQCNATIVNENHAGLAQQNPTLVPGNGTEFKCYRMEAAVLDQNNTDTGIRGYLRGCTFLSTNFCTGWINSLNVTSCTTCTTDNCDKNPAPTVAPPTTSATVPTTNATVPTTNATVPTTNATVPTTNATAPTANTTLPTTISTTTKPSGGGASVLTQISMTGLGSLSVVLLLAGR
uniref:Uncharacterized protein n=1 Tax=Anopheles farauti TaxID=69004 RepID=A0A182QS03_9DIPT